jgi:hypothetical protein
VLVKLHDSPGVNFPAQLDFTCVLPRSRSRLPLTKVPEMDPIWDFTLVLLSFWMQTENVTPPEVNLLQVSAAADAEAAGRTSGATAATATAESITVLRDRRRDNPDFTASPVLIKSVPHR